jgi:hypothetical protein
LDYGREASPNLHGLLVFSLRALRDRAAGVLFVWWGMARRYYADRWCANPSPLVYEYCFAEGG